MKTTIGEHGLVALYDVYPHVATSADMEVVAAARTSYNGEMKGPDKDLALLRYLIRNRHDSPLEMVDVTMMVEAPLVVWWQWVRHRTFSYNFQSGRYTPFDENRTLVPMPDEWRLQSTDNKQGSDGYLPQSDGAVLSEALAAMYAAAFDLYNAMLEKGVAREQARLALPGFALFYRARVKANLRAWLHWLSLRNEAHAQHEIQQYAMAVEGIIADIAPYTLRYWRDYRNGDNNESIGTV